jgi:hypothetical protein
MQDEDLIKLINKSGFPFQLRVEHEIQRTKSDHKWELASREHPWSSTTNNELYGYIDLVLNHSEMPGDRLVVECKRIKGDDERQLQWLFLIPEGSRETPIVSCLELFGRIPTKHVGEWKEARKGARIWE